jgi:hypothetical protein
MRETRPPRPTPAQEVVGLKLSAHLAAAAHSHHPERDLLLQLAAARSGWLRYQLCDAPAAIAVNFHADAAESP